MREEVYTKAQHTPTPWKAIAGIEEDDPNRWGVVQGGPVPYLIAIIENGAPGDTLASERANADLIVRAVNSHAALVEALECNNAALAAALIPIEEFGAGIGQAAADLREQIRLNDAALAAAKGNL